MLHCLLRNGAQSVSRAARSPRSIVSVTKRRATSLSSTSPTQQEHETFTLANGHTVGFSTCGSKNAPALFYFHGQGSSRLQGLAFAESANNIGVRIISPDRPVIGLSTFDPGRKLLDYPPQIAQLARHRGLETYRVMSGSGGGPYALSCAYALPRTQLKCAAILAELGLSEDASFSNMRLGTRLLSAGLRFTPVLVGVITDLAIGRKARDPNPEVMGKKLKLFEEKPEIIDEIIQDFREHFRQGPQGFVRDGETGVQPWGFRLEDVPFKEGSLYYGSEDINTPTRMGRNMAAKLKDAVSD